MCSGSSPSWCWNPDTVEGRLTHAAGFHMTCQRRILGIRWNDFITNRAVTDSTNLPSIPRTIAARRHSIFGHIRRLPDSTPAHKALKLAVDSRSGDTPHHDWNHPLVDHGLHGWVRSCGTPDSLLLTLLLMTGQHGGRYDPQLVTRSSEWI